MQEGEWDRGRGKVEEGEKRKGDEGDIGRGREKGDEGERCDVPQCWVTANRDSDFNTDS